MAIMPYLTKNERRSPLLSLAVVAVLVTIWIIASVRICVIDTRVEDQTLRREVVKAKAKIRISGRFEGVEITNGSPNIKSFFFQAE